jgi:hypothetical protein
MEGILFLAFSDLYQAGYGHLFSLDKICSRFASIRAKRTQSCNEEHADMAC